MSTEAARAYARAAAVEASLARYFHTACGCWQRRDEPMRWPAKRGYWVCDYHGHTKILTARTAHSEDCTGCAWCVDDPRELF